MGLDAVEIILRAEELFAITIGDDEAQPSRTFGEFYNPDLRETERNSIAVPGHSRDAPQDHTEG